MAALLSLFLILIASLVTIRSGAIVLEYTGLSRDISRFQARSAFTGAGFTTSEAEQVVEHPVRRRVVMWLMLIGNVGFVSATASLLFSVSGLAEAESAALTGSLLAGGVVFLCIFETNAWIDRVMCNALLRLCRRMDSGMNLSYGSLVSLPNGYEVAELPVPDGHPLTGLTYAEVEAAALGVRVLGKRGPRARFQASDSGETQVEAGDRLSLFGSKASIRSLAAATTAQPAS